MQMQISAEALSAISLSLHFLPTYCVFAALFNGSPFLWKEVVGEKSVRSKLSRPSFSFWRSVCVQISTQRRLER